MVPTIEKNCEATTGVWRRSWECLAFYAQLCRKIAKALQLLAEGKKTDMQPAWEEICVFVRQNELRFQREFDVFNFLLVWENKIINRLQDQEEAFIE